MKKPTNPGYTAMVDELASMSIAANDEFEAYLDYAQDLSDYCDAQDEHISALMAELGTLRHGSPSDKLVADLQSQVQFLNAKLMAIALVMR